MGLTRQGGGCDLAEFNAIITLCWGTQRGDKSLDDQAISVNKQFQLVHSYVLQEHVFPGVRS